MARCNAVGGGAHTRGTLVSRDGEIDFIAFNKNPSCFYNKVIDVLATPQLNKHLDQEIPQLCIVDYQESY